MDSPVPPALIHAIRRQYRLEWDGVHGAAHWARVLRNGIDLAARTGARPDVVSLFAVLHDACRYNDDHDPEHGLRGAELAARLHGSCFEIDAPGLRLLCVACETHTEGTHHPDITVRTCWDADRLDLWRVGIRPHPDRLATEAARDPEVIRAAVARSERGEFPWARLFEGGRGTVPGGL